MESNCNQLRSLAEILKIEDDVHLIQYECPETGAPIWPLIRVPFIRTIMSSWFYATADLITSGKKYSYLAQAKTTGFSMLHNMCHKDDLSCGIIIQSTGLGNYRKNDQIHDRLAGYFADVYPAETVISQYQPKGSFSLEFSFKNTIFHTPREIVGQLLSRVRVRARHVELANAVISKAVSNANYHLKFKFSRQQLDILATVLARRIAILPYNIDVNFNWFAKRNFKILIKEDACYGGGSIHSIFAAKLNNMVVAEYQHGVISKGHDAYNFSNALAVSDNIKQILPDYLLTYGNWWSKQSNIPVTKVAIGNPHLSESIRGLVNSVKKIDRILVLGDGIETELYLKLAKKISNIVGKHGTTVTFRPHPFERERVTSSILPSCVKLDHFTDIYPSLMASRIVISELSTGLFEAIGLVDRVLLWKTEKSKFAFPDIPFESFSTIEELQAILESDEPNSIPSAYPPVGDMWEPNWRSRYIKFVEDQFRAAL